MATRTASRPARHRGPMPAMTARVRIGGTGAGAATVALVGLELVNLVASAPATDRAMAAGPGVGPTPIHARAAADPTALTRNPARVGLIFRSSAGNGQPADPPAGRDAPGDPSFDDLLQGLGNHDPTPMQGRFRRRAAQAPQAEQPVVRAARTTHHANHRPLELAPGWAWTTSSAAPTMPLPLRPPPAATQEPESATKAETYEPADDGPTAAGPVPTIDGPQAAPATAATPSTATTSDGRAPVAADAAPADPVAAAREPGAPAADLGSRMTSALVADRDPGPAASLGGFGGGRCGSNAGTI